MKNLVRKLKEIWSIQELRERLLTTLGLVLIYRVGTFVILPGIDPNMLAALVDNSKGGVLDLVNLFAGGAFNRASILALGIMPYISASIMMQIGTLAVPRLQKMQKEGESGRNQITQITRYLTILVTVAQSYGYITYVTATAGAAIIMPMGFFVPLTMIVLTAGTVFVMWIGEKITDKGIGNGISLLIMVGIIANLPFAFAAEFVTRSNGNGGLISIVVEMVFLVGVIIATILLVQGTRRIPVQYAKRVVGNRQYGGQRQYLPLKVNAAGVMPIIFAQALMFIPASVAQFLPGSLENSSFIQAFNDFSGLWYNIVYGTLVVVFTYFYTALIVNPIQMADEMKRNNGFIPGVKPGRKTAEFIDSIMSRITLPGSMFLAFVAILPAIAMQFSINQQFAMFYGGTSLLILVAVVLDTLQQIESHLLMRHYDGLMKSGKIKGRGSQQAVGASV